MGRTVALLHTSFVLLERERSLLELMAEMLPDVELINIVEDKMLEQVVQTGYITPDVTRRMCYYVLAAEAMGVDAIFNTCSSLGPTMDVAEKLVSIPIVKIDDGMAEKAAKEGQRIGVMATVPSTLKPTINLINEKARMLKRRVEARDVLVRGAFQALLTGDKDRHDHMVSRKAREVSQWADTVVLAQVTMARLAPRLSAEVGLPVLSSLHLGVEHLKKVLEGVQ